MDGGCRGGKEVDGRERGAEREQGPAYDGPTTRQKAKENVREREEKERREMGLRKRGALFCEIRHFPYILHLLGSKAPIQSEKHIYPS